MDLSDRNLELLAPSNYVKKRCLAAEMRVAEYPVDPLDPLLALGLNRPRKDQTSSCCLLEAKLLFAECVVLPTATHTFHQPRDLPRSRLVMKTDR